MENVKKLITQADGYQLHLIAPEQGYRRLIVSRTRALERQGRNDERRLYLLITSRGPGPRRSRNDDAPEWQTSQRNNG
jgi:hypothetical protein